MQFPLALFFINIFFRKMRKSSIVVIFLFLLLGCNESPQFTLQEIGVKRLGIAKPKIICYSAPDSCFFLITEDYTLAKLDLNLEVLQTKTLPPDQYKALFSDEGWLYAMSKNSIYFIDKAKMDFAKKVNVSKYFPKFSTPVVLTFNPVKKAFILVVQTRLPIVYEFDPLNFRKVGTKKLDRVSQVACGFSIGTSLFLVNDAKKEIFELDMNKDYSITRSFRYPKIEVSSATFSSLSGLMLLSSELRRIFIYKFQNF